MRIRRQWSVLFAGASFWAFSHVAVAQDASPAAATQVTEPAAAVATPTTTVEPAAPTPTTAAADVPAQAAAPAEVATTPAVAATAVTPAVKPVAMVKQKAKKEKEVYTGPTTVIVLAPTPMLDEEGKQRMDPDGKLMFNKPIAQQRDKKGHPLFDEQNKPVFQTANELGYDEHGKKLHVEKIKPPKMTPVVISRGTFTIDGMIGKAELNYDIADLKYIYLYAPTIGTIVVSNEPFPGATAEPKAFDNLTLTVTVGDHTLQVASDKRLLSKKPEPAYVLLDRNFRLPSKYPVVGYGIGVKAPYSWPGGRPNSTLDAASAIQPPPIPVNLRPVMLMQPCPAGQMRKAAPPVLPGEVAPEQPCILIPKSLPVQTAAAKTEAAPAAVTEGQQPIAAKSSTPQK
jgi:hypothetical protein